MELDYRSIGSEVYSDNASTTKCDESVPIPESPNDYLEQIEVFDSSGLTTSLIEILESTESTFLNKKGTIDIVTHDGILTEFLQRITDLINRQMKRGAYYLKMENEDDSSRNN